MQGAALKKAGRQQLQTKIVQWEPAGVLHSVPTDPRRRATKEHALHCRVRRPLKSPRGLQSSCGSAELFAQAPQLRPPQLRSIGPLKCLSSGPKHSHHKPAYCRLRAAAPTGAPKVMGSRGALQTPGLTITGCGCSAAPLRGASAEGDRSKPATAAAMAAAARAVVAGAGGGAEAGVGRASLS